MRTLRMLQRVAMSKFLPQPKIKKRLEIKKSLPWLIPLSAFIFPVGYCLAAYLTMGSIPVINRIYLSEEHPIQLPFPYSSAWDIILAPLLAYIFICIYRHKWMKDMDLRNIMLLGLGFGICKILAIDPGFVLVIGFFTGLGIMFCFGSDSGFKTGATFSFGLGLGIGVGLVFGFGFISGLTMGLGAGMVLGMGMGLVMGFVTLVGGLLGTVIAVLRAYLSRSSEMVKS